MLFLFFLNTPPTPPISPLSLHDALPISLIARPPRPPAKRQNPKRSLCARRRAQSDRSEEHTSELQSRGHLVCRLLLEKKKIQPPELSAVSCRWFHHAARSNLARPSTLCA